MEHAQMLAILYKFIVKANERPVIILIVGRFFYPQGNHENRKWEISTTTANEQEAQGVALFDGRGVECVCISFAS